VSPEIRTGSTVQEIVAATVAGETDLIVFPWKRQTLLKRSLMGNVMRDLARQTDLPLLVVRSGETTGEHGPPEEVGGGDGPAPRDGKPDSVGPAAAGLSALFATDPGVPEEPIISILTDGSIPLSRLKLVYAGERAPDPHAEEERTRQVQDALDRIASRIEMDLPQSSPIPVQTETLVGSPRDRLPRYIRRVEPDLVLIGKGGGSGGIAGIMGSVSEEVAYRAPVSVLIVPAPTGGDS
jgi:nucleotide-binding universal stress UspA family protein